MAAEYRTPKIQLGIDVDAYTYKGENMAASARAVVKYVRSLHANAISITFPFFMNGPHGRSGDHAPVDANATHDGGDGPDRRGARPVRGVPATAG